MSMCPCFTSSFIQGVFFGIRLFFVFHLNKAIDKSITVVMLFPNNHSLVLVITVSFVDLVFSKE